MCIRDSRCKQCPAGLPRRSEHETEGKSKSNHASLWLSSLFSVFSGSVQAFYCRTQRGSRISRTLTDLVFQCTWSADIHTIAAVNTRQKRFSNRMRIALFIHADDTHRTDIHTGIAFYAFFLVRRNQFNSFHNKIPFKTESIQRSMSLYTPCLLYTSRCV